MPRKSRSNRRRIRSTRRSRRAPALALLDQKALAYRRLLLDPCHGPLVPPTAIGPTSGLLFRQKKIIPLSFTHASVSSSNTPSTASFLAIYRPCLGQVSMFLGHPRYGTAASVQAVTIDLEDGVLATARSYRPVAGCMKFIPTGTIAYRRGTISAGYFADSVRPGTVTTGDALEERVLGLMAACQQTSTNSSGPEIAEVRWIPSESSDLDFRDRLETYTPDTGTCVLVGTDVDSTPVYANAMPPYSITGGEINGYLEVTTVWEWLPDYTSGVTSSVQAGSATSYQSVLATLGDVGKAATNHPYAQQLLGAAVRGAASMAGSYMAGLANVMYRQTASSSFLLPG